MPTRRTEENQRLLAAHGSNGTLLQIDREDPQAVKLVQRNFYLRLAAHPLFKDLTAEQAEIVAHLQDEWDGTIGDLINVA